MTTESKLTESYYKGSQAVPLLNATIGESFDSTAQRFPNHLALVHKHQNIRWTYRQYQQKVNKLAMGLIQLGIAKGDRVGIWAPNCYEWCLVQFASAKIGAIMVCINPAYRASELEYVLNQSECKALVMAECFKTSDYIGILQSIVPELHSAKSNLLQLDQLPHLKTCIRMGNTKTAGMYNFDEVLARGGKFNQSLADLNLNLTAKDAINIQYTSGTTGRPKGATLTHHNILNNGNIVGDTMQLTENDKLCVPVPLYHCFGMVMGNLACITRGAAAIFPADSFDPESTLQTVAEEQCTALYGVPTMFIAELELENFNDYDISSLRTGIMAGSTCPIDVMKKVIDKMNMKGVLIAYGQTETSPVNHITELDDPLEKRVTSVGRAAPHLEIKIVDTNNTVAINTAGELCVRGYAIMQSYWKNEEQTKATIDADGWHHSGDLAVMDEQGYVDIVGRIKDMIIRGGENVYPKEVEEFLYTHPDIIEAQVFGIPDKHFGEVVCAWVKTHNNQLTEEDIKAFCKQQIAYYKVPKHINFVDEYPITVSGKIQKFRMREIMLEQLNSSNA